MLYISTRSRTDSFTAFRTLHEEFAPDGGMFVPFRMPVFTTEEITAMANGSFGETVANILNTFFSAGLTGWDVDFCVGRRPVKLIRMNHRLIVAELWHNHESDYRFLEESLYCKLCGKNVASQPTQWAKIAIRIAVLFGIWPELSGSGIEEPDIAITTGDFSIPMAVWYARKMGLPIGRIICSGSDNGAIWDLLHRGELSTATAVIPACIEQLIFATLEMKENLRYLDCRSKRTVYTLDEDHLEALNAGMFASVVGATRVNAIVSSIFRTCSYIANRDTALSYGGLQDYRARTGISQTTILFAQRSPVFETEMIQDILRIPAEEIRKRVNQP